MRKATFRTDELRTAFEAGFGMRLRSLERVDGASALNYKAVRESDGLTFALKLFPASRRELRDGLVRHLDFLGRDGGVRTARRLFADGPEELLGHAVVCCGWCEGRRVFPDRLTADELAAFLDEYLRLSKALQGVEQVRPRYPVEQWRRAVVWALAKSKTMRDFGRELEQGIPSEDATYREDLVRTIHGDFHHGNFHFLDGRLSGVFDLEEFRFGYPAEDIVRYFICAAVHLRWYERGRMRGLHKAFSDAVRHLPYSAHEWKVAVNGLLLRKVLSILFERRCRRIVRWRLRRNLDMYAAFRDVAERSCLHETV